MLRDLYGLNSISILEDTQNDSLFEPWDAFSINNMNI